MYMILFWKMIIIKHLYVHNATRRPPNDSWRNKDCGQSVKPKGTAAVMCTGIQHCFSIPRRCGLRIAGGPKDRGHSLYLVAHCNIRTILATKLEEWSRAGRSGVLVCANRNRESEVPSEISFASQSDQWQQDCSFSDFHHLLAHFILSCLVAFTPTSYALLSIF